MNTLKHNSLIIACLGDSLTDGHPGWSCSYGSGEDERSCYQYWLNQYIHEDFGEKLRKQERRLDFVNRGVCGEITSQIKERLYPDIIDLKREDGVKPDVIIIVAGTNDLGWGIDTGAIAGNIADMHRSCAKEGITSVGAAIPPARFEDDPGYGGRKLSANAQIKEFFKAEGVPWADLYTGMAAGGGDRNLAPELDTGDGLHFAVAGYSKMAEVIYGDAIKKIIDTVVS